MGGATSTCEQEGLAHCRRPHADDRNRVEQLLRDLEVGIRRAIDAYNRLHRPARTSTDPIVQDWLHQKHEVARRLIDHGRKNYGISFHLGYSVRPWAQVPSSGGTISGTEGVLWQWHGGCDSWIDPVRYWNSHYVQSVAATIVHVVIPTPFRINVTFPAVDDPVDVSDAIAATFEALFTDTVRLTPATDPEKLWERHRRRAEETDSRVLVENALAYVDEDAPPLTFFSA